MCGLLCFYPLCNLFFHCSTAEEVPIPTTLTVSQAWRADSQTCIQPQQAQCAYSSLLGWHCTQWQADFGLAAPSQHGLLPGTYVLVPHTVCRLKDPHSCSCSGSQASDCSTICLLTIWINCRRSAMCQIWIRVSCLLSDRVFLVLWEVSQCCTKENISDHSTWQSRGTENHQWQMYELRFSESQGLHVSH